MDLNSHQKTHNMRLITQLFSDQSDLANSHSKRDKSVVPFCRFCPSTKETNEHFIGSCPAYSKIRQDIFGKTSITFSDIVTNFPPKSLAKYYKLTGRDKDEYVCYYIDSD